MLSRLSVKTTSKGNIFGRSLLSSSTNYTPNPCLKCIHRDRDGLNECSRYRGENGQPLALTTAIKPPMCNYGENRRTYVYVSILLYFQVVGVCDVVCYLCKW